MKSNLTTISPWKSILFSAILFFCALSPSYAADVSLEWDANTEPDLAGYKIYYDTDSGEPYEGTGASQGSSPITVPIGDLTDSDNPEYTLTGLTDGVTYFFVVTAYDTEDLESDYSNEVFTPTVTFTSAIQSQAEDSGNMTITCELSAASGLDVEIPFSVSGTATDAADYSITASPVTINAGLTQTTITISVDADSMDEPDETVIVDMGTPTNATQGATTQHTATITDDDDPPVVSFSAAPYTHNETPGSQTITVTLSAESGKVVTVNYATADGTATAGDDYTETSGTLTWAIGETGEKSFAVPILGDALDEEDETVELTLSSPGNCTIGGTNPETLTITDDDAPLDGDDDGIPDEWEIANGLNPLIDDSDHDPDDDGLTNIGEYQHGTDPNSSDTDTDGMPDGWEVTYGLDPLVNDASEDADNDEYTNLQEYLYGTQPNDSNSKPQPPTADAGPDQTVDEGVTVTLNGSNSSDPDDDGIASYLWEQTSGNSMTLSDPTAVQPTFASPDVGPDGESLTFQLTVTDYTGLEDTDTCVVNVTWDNDPPTADAGPDQTVDEGVTVTLDGSNSSDPDDGIHRYLWTQTVGTPVTLSDAAAVQPTFVTPPLDSDGTHLEFLLTVIDNGGLQSTDTCIVNVTWDNDPPTADAGPDQTVDEGVTVTLDGSNSSDPDDGIHRYLWTQTVGTPVTLSDATAVQPTFVTPTVDSNGTHLEFLLSVTDNGGLVHTDLVSIDVEDNGIIDFPSDVLPTESSAGKNVGIIVKSGGNIVSFMTASPQSVPDTTNMPDDLIYGLIDMQLKPDAVGGTVTVTIYLENPAPDGYVWYKYGPNNGWYVYSDHAEFNADRDQVTLTLVDGGIGDDDGVANGVIVDPSGLGCTPTGYTTSGGSGCFIATAAFGSNMDRHVPILSQFRDKRLANNHRGQRVIALYYKFSPPIADFLRRHPLARAAVRYGLIPITGVAYVALYVHPGVLLFSFILLLLIGVYCARPYLDIRRDR